MNDNTEALLAAAATVPDDEKLVQVRDLALAYVRAEATVAAIEERLKKAKEAARDLAERQLPERLQALGLPGVKLPNDAELELKPFCACTIPEEKRERAYKWLVEIGAGDLIKNEVVASFVRGEEELANGMRALLQRWGFTVEQKKTVHFQTLNAMLRRRLESGEKDAIDPTAVDVYAGTHAKLKVPKGVTLADILGAAS